MIYILMGAPGAGKGTQADLLVERQGFVKVSTGDALRNQIKQGTEVGQKASGYMSAGQLVPDEILLEILKAELRDKRDEKVLLDGYPRNLSQAETLMEISEQKPIKAAIHIDVDQQQLIERLSGRRVCSQCGATFHVQYNPPKANGVCDRCSVELVQRPDDHEEKVKVRLQVYEETTKPVLDFYKNRKLYHYVDGNGTTEDVYERLVKTLNEVD
jgi:adenylate kinase